MAMAREKQPETMTLDPELVELAAGNKKKKAPKGEKVEAAKVEAPKAAEPAEETPKAEEAPKAEPKVACFITKREYPISETVELKYKNQMVRVAKTQVRYQTA
jgi:hypothetical protein